jgi:hypothetical protein
LVASVGDGDRLLRQTSVNGQAMQSPRQLAKLKHVHEPVGAADCQSVAAWAERNGLTLITTRLKEIGGSLNACCHIKDVNGHAAGCYKLAVRTEANPAWGAAGACVGRSLRRRDQSEFPPDRRSVPHLQYLRSGSRSWFSVGDTERIAAEDERNTGAIRTDIGTIRFGFEWQVRYRLGQASPVGQA